ncbi:MAG: glucohydrolase, partial [Bacilli bacterium]
LKEIEQYNDIESLNAYDAMLKQGLAPQQALSKLQLVSRDNARTPMPWNNEPYNGFSMSLPWHSMTQNNDQINVASDLKSSKSIYYYYQKIIKLRKENYNLIKEQATFEVVDNVLIITRKDLRMIMNFSALKIATTSLNEVLVSNYPIIDKDVLNPYQVIITR